MSGFVYQPAATSGAWQRYLDREHAARDAYLGTTMAAHREYLMGPWPDREAYQHVEHSAWVTYYAAGREAWRIYTQEITPPPPPPAQHSAASQPYPARAFDELASGQWPAQPTYTPTDGGNQ